MSTWDYDRFRRALRLRDDYEARRMAEEIWSKSFNKYEAAENIARIMKEERPLDTREWGNEVTYDGITVRHHGPPRLEVKEDDLDD